ncbi:MAG: hypothetical protein K6U88_07195 [Dehalococcoidia bacterium]|jgi:hypothetical protein|nr:hypothetical protein [Dehalococcoidia bacterium]
MTKRPSRPRYEATRLAVAAAAASLVAAAWVAIAAAGDGDATIITPRPGSALLADSRPLAGASAPDASYFQPDRAVKPAQRQRASRGS